MTDAFREVAPNDRYQGMTELSRNTRTWQMPGTGRIIRKALIAHADKVTRNAVSIKA